MTTECEYCAANASIYVRTQRCCNVRYIANMPADRRERYYKQVLNEQGKAAANKLIEEVNALRQQKRAEKLKQLNGEGKQ
jgi:hypothetical protein